MFLSSIRENFLYRFLTSQWAWLPYPRTDFTNQTIIVTGANVGLGLEAARHFVRLNAKRVILAARSLSKLESAKSEIESATGRTGVCDCWEVDFSNFASVRAFATRFERELERVNVVVENAGIGASTYVEMEGHESQITVNVLSTFLLAALLLPKLRSSAITSPGYPSHLTIVTSGAYEVATLDDSIWASDNICKAASEGARLDQFPVGSMYAKTKLFEVLLTRELARRIPGNEVIINCVNPGFCLGTQLGRHKTRVGWDAFQMSVQRMLLARSAEVGSRNYLACAAMGAESHGRYVNDCVVVKTYENIPKDASERLFDQVSNIVGVSLPV